MKSETMRFPSYFKGIHEVEKQLDPVNVKILSAMWRFGPRNLLEVSRRTGLPFTTVYHRVNKLEAKSRRIAYLMPQTNLLGLTRVIVAVVARTGHEEDVVRALEIPNFWRSINSCEGKFTHLSTHSVPIDSLRDFEEYVSQLSKSGFISEFQLILTSDPIPNFPDFSCYEPKLEQWSFRWNHWSRTVQTLGPSVIEDPEDYGVYADHRDLIIIEELQANARKSFVELAPLLGISGPAVKYRYDRLVSSGIVKHFEFDVYPFPVEISAYHEVLLEFTSAKAMNRFVTLISKLFFVIAVAKVLKQNTLVIRTYLPETQVGNMFSFFSELAKAGMLSSYSSLRIDFASRQTQTISFELFDDEKGWTFDLTRSLSELRALVQHTGIMASRPKTAKST